MKKSSKWLYWIGGAALAVFLIGRNRKSQPKSAVYPENPAEEEKEEVVTVATPGSGRPMDVLVYGGRVRVRYTGFVSTGVWQPQEIEIVGGKDEPAKQSIIAQSDSVVYVDLLETPQSVYYGNTKVWG